MLSSIEAQIASALIIAGGLLIAGQACPGVVLWPLALTCIAIGVLALCSLELFTFFR